MSDNTIYKCKISNNKINADILQSLPKGKTITKINSNEVPLQKEDYNGIRLYFVRYGVLDDNIEDTRVKSYSTAATPRVVKFGSEERLVTANPDLIPNLSNIDNNNSYYYRVMPLREGWLYVYSQEAEGVYKFYFNGSSFVKKDFICKTKKENFWVIDTGPGPYLSLSDKDKIQYAFLDVDLTREAIIQQFLNAKQIMQEFDCEAWSQGNRAADMSKTMQRDVMDLSVNYPLDGECGYSENSIRKHVRVIDQAILNNEGRETQKDAFLLVSDPIGCCIQLVSDLQALHLDHETLLRSIRTGVDFKEMRNKIKNYDNSNNPDDIITDKMVLGYEPSLQCQYIHSMAVLLYKFLYKAEDKDESDFKKKAKRSTDREKITKILGQVPRLNLIDLIDNQRIILLKFLESPFFQKNHVNFFNTISNPTENATKKQRISYNKMLLDAKSINMDIYSELAILPHTKDFYIEGKFANYKDFAEDFLSKVLDGENESGKLMHKEIDILELDSDENIASGKFVNIDKLFKMTRSAAISFWRLMYNTTSHTTIRGLTLFENNTARGLFRVGKEELDDALRAMKKELVPGQMGKTIQAAAGNMYRFLEPTPFDARNNSFTVHTRQAFEGRAQNVFANAKRSAPAAIKYVTTHPVFFAVSAIFQIRSFKSIQQSNDLISFGISSGQFITGIASLRALFLEGMTEKGYVNLDLKKFGGQFRLFGRIATALDIGDSFYKVRSIWNTKDTDAKLLYFTAGVSGMGLFVAGFLLQGTTYGGWVGLVGALVVIGIKTAADYFKDTSFETFIKDTVFAESYTKYFDFPNANKKETIYLDINQLATDYSKSQCSNNKKFMSNYSYQIEELLLAHLLVPYFDIKFSYLTGAVVAAQGTYVFSSDLVRGVSLDISINLAYYNSQITDIEITSYYSKFGGKSFWNKADGVVLGDTNIGKSSKDVYKRNEVKDNYFNYSYIKTENKKELEYFLHNPQAYIITFIRFSTNGETFLPYMRNNEPTYLIYRHCITLEETAYKSKQLDYGKPQIALDRVIIGSWEEGWTK